MREHCDYASDSDYGSTLVKSWGDLLLFLSALWPCLLLGQHEWVLVTRSTMINHLCPHIRWVWVYKRGRKLTTDVRTLSGAERHRVRYSGWECQRDAEKYVNCLLDERKLKDTRRFFWRSAMDSLLGRRNL